MVSPCGPGGTPRTAWKCGRSSIRACLTAPLGRPLLRGGGEVRVDLGKCRDSATPARSISRSGGGRRFESVRGLCKSPVNRSFCVQVDLLLVECAVGMEPFMELSVSDRLGDRVSSGNTSAGDPPGRRGAELRR